MTQQHPITPPPELVEQWIKDANNNDSMFAQVAIMGAHWGSDQELEACCEWLSFYSAACDARDLRAARRPKPPSLKEQALGALENLNGECLLEGFECPEKVAIIRRALESLPS